MALLLLKARMALELPAINRTLDTLLQELPEPTRAAARHTVKAGGKRLRPLLCLLCARLMGAGADEGLYRLACTLEMLHAATLMHDDVIDNAPLRRGNPAVHTVVGNTEAILAGDALLSTANACVAHFGNPRLCEVFARATAETAAGEILELHAMHNPGLEGHEYLAIIRGKTACLIRAACEMGALYAGADERRVAALGAYGEALGMAFQMVDDALDVADEAIIGKPTGGDLREGKLTPPLQLYRSGLDEAQRTDFNAKFASAGFTDEEVASICRKIRDLGLDDRVRDMAQGYLDQGREAITALPESGELDVLLEILTYVRDRKK